MPLILRSNSSFLYAWAAYTPGSFSPYFLPRYGGRTTGGPYGSAILGGELLYLGRYYDSPGSSGRYDGNYGAIRQGRVEWKVMGRMDLPRW